jgi:hypothetical protein
MSPAGFGMILIVPTGADPGLARWACGPLLLILTAIHLVTCAVCNADSFNPASLVLLLPAMFCGFLFVRWLRSSWCSTKALIVGLKSMPNRWRRLG